MVRSRGHRSMHCCQYWLEAVGACVRQTDWGANGLKGREMRDRFSTRWNNDKRGEKI